MVRCTDGKGMMGRKVTVSINRALGLTAGIVTILRDSAVDAFAMLESVP
jgi:hypothetical protein